MFLNNQVTESLIDSDSVTLTFIDSVLIALCKYKLGIPAPGLVGVPAPLDFTSHLQQALPVP